MSGMKCRLIVCILAVMFKNIIENYLVRVSYYLVRVSYYLIMIHLYSYIVDSR